MTGCSGSMVCSNKLRKYRERVIAVYISRYGAGQAPSQRFHYVAPNLTSCKHPSFTSLRHQPVNYQSPPPLSYPQSQHVLSLPPPPLLPPIPQTPTRPLLPLVPLPQPPLRHKNTRNRYPLHWLRTRVQKKLQSQSRNRTIRDV